MMLKRFLQWVSTLLVIVFVFQMLPLQVLAAQNTQSPAAGVNEEQLPASAEATVVAELTEERDTEDRGRFSVLTKGIRYAILKQGDVICQEEHESNQKPAFIM